LEKLLLVLKTRKGASVRERENDERSEQNKTKTAKKAFGKISSYQSHF
jgi:hypothetical protein